MAFGLMQAVSHLEQRNPAVVYLSHFIALCLEIFIWKLSANIENNRVVAVSLFYKTKRIAEGLVSFAKNDQKVNQ